MNTAIALQDFRRRLIGRRALYLEVFDTPSGKLVLKDLFKFCKMGQDILVSGDPHATAYNVGRQRVFLRIQSILKMDSDTIDAISKENT